MVLSRFFDGINRNRQPVPRLLSGPQLASVTEMPRGGFTQSDSGKELSMYRFEDYTLNTRVMSGIG